MSPTGLFDYFTHAETLTISKILKLVVALIWINS